MKSSSTTTILLYLFTVACVLMPQAAKGKIQHQELWEVTKESEVKKRRTLRGSSPRHLKALERIEGGLTVRMLKAKKVSALDFERQEDGNIYLPLILPSSEQVTFELKETNVMHPDLAAKFPEIKTYSGVSVGFNRVITAEIDYSPEGGLRAYIRDTHAEYFLDPIDLTEDDYKVYRTADILRRHPWSCSVHSANPQGRPPLQDDHDHDHDHYDGEDIIDVSDPGFEANKCKSIIDHYEEEDDSAYQYEFTLALVANGQYSAYHGNTKQSVLKEMVTVVNRVNSIFKRDLSVTFQLHKDTDKLICLSPCASLKNNGNILDQMPGFISNQGISSDTYDLGHSFTTGSGGLAYLRSACGPWKAGGTTGLSNPQSDVFMVDYVSHEIGHQLNGQHSFSDCSGHYEHPNTGASPVEPGSGSTIMSYAGICGSTNIQANTDAMFHSRNIQEMGAFIRYLTDDDCYKCGKKKRAGTRPTTNMPSTCSVPLKNYFQLALDSSSSDKNSYYTFEQVDEVTERPKYFDRKVGRFRTWMPTQRSSRMFPNMYYIIHDLVDDVVDEVLPTRAEEMNIRTLTRTRFSAIEDVGYGSTSYSDTKVSFEKLNPLLFNTKIKGLQANQQLDLKWKVGQSDRLTETVKIYIVEHDNSMDQISGDFDYREQIVDYNWQLVAHVPNNGRAEITIPPISDSLSGKTLAHLMIRSEDDQCFFFDMIPFISFANTRLSVPQPSPSPGNGDGDGDGDEEEPEYSLEDWEKMNARCAKKRSENSCIKQSTCAWDADEETCGTNLSMPPTPSPVPSASPTTYEEFWEDETEECESYLEKSDCSGAKNLQGKKRCRWDKRSSKCISRLKAPPTASPTRSPLEQDEWEELDSLCRSFERNRRNCQNTAGCVYDRKLKMCHGPENDR